jgi:hypothetical protein
MSAQRSFFGLICLVHLYLLSPETHRNRNTRRVNCTRQDQSLGKGVWGGGLIRNEGTSGQVHQASCWIEKQSLIRALGLVEVKAALGVSSVYRLGSSPQVCLWL